MDLSHASQANYEARTSNGPKRATAKLFGLSCQTEVQLVVDVLYMAFDTYWVPIGVSVLFIIGTLGVMGIFSRKNHFDVDGRVGTTHP